MENRHIEKISDGEIQSRINDLLNILERKSSGRARQFSMKAEALIWIDEYEPGRLANLDKRLLSDIIVTFYDTKVFSHYVKLVDKADQDFERVTSRGDDYLEYLEGKLNLFQRDVYRYIWKKTIQNIEYKLEKGKVTGEEKRFLESIKRYLESIREASNQTIQNRMKKEDGFSPLNRFLPYKYIEPKIRLSRRGVLPIKDFMSLVAETQTNQILKFYDQGGVNLHRAKIYIKFGLDDLGNGIDINNTNLGDYEDFSDLAEELEQRRTEEKEFVTIKNKFSDILSSFEKNCEKDEYVIYFALKVYFLLHSEKGEKFTSQEIGIRNGLIQYFNDHELFFDELTSKVAEKSATIQGKNKSSRVREYILKLIRKTSDQVLSEMGDEIRDIMM